MLFRSGVCNGAGACALYGTSQVCDTTASCDSSNASVIVSKACNGAGSCVPSSTFSCNGFVCSAGACGTSCSGDSECSSGRFCSATACFASPVNLAGNGDLEYGAATGWSSFGGGGTLVLENAGTSPTLVNSGTFAIADTARAQNYQGPSYNLPTGAGQYVVSAWAMQNDNPTQTVALQIQLTCKTSTSYPTIGMFGLLLSQGVWTHITGTVDFATQGTPAGDCQPTATTPGAVKSAVLYLNQTVAGAPVALPNLFLDDVTVQVSDGHNLVGNPNFEANLTSGWQNNGGGVVGISTTNFKSGAMGLGVTGRLAPSNGPRWNLPLGAAKYNVVFNALHTGAQVHDLVLQPTYTCLGGAGQYPAAIATAAALPKDTWTQLSGTVTLPPADAVAGCKLSSAAVYVQQGGGGTCGSGTGQVECPDLFIDDVSITLSP